MSTQPSLPQWDLRDFYENRDDPAMYVDLQELHSLTDNFATKYKGQVTTNSGKTLGKAVKEYEKIQELAAKLNAYAYLQYSEDMGFAKGAVLYQNISEEVNDIIGELLFFELELNKITDADVKQKFAESTSLRYYASWIRDIRASRPHQLEEIAEKIFHDKRITSYQSWVRLFEETIIDMRFSYKNKKLNSTEIFDLLSDADETIRLTASKSISQAFEKQQKTFTLITNTLAKDKAIEDQWRGFKRPISSRNLDNLIEDNVTDALIKTVKDNYENLSHRYYHLKAKWLGKEQLHYSDRNAPLPGQDETYIPYRDAKQLIIHAYFSFSPSMARIAKQFFSKNWIDAALRPGKDPGAFSHPTVPSVHPYILLNYQGKVRDVMTLAHELGHGVHQVLSASQGLLMCDTPLTLAETASVFGEQLTFQALLKRQKDNTQRHIMIANKVQDMLNTVVRQVAFCEFESKVHNMRKSGELSTQAINDAWMQTQSHALGPAVLLDETYQYYWMNIPHFIHTPFYVYAYAFGDCLVNSLYQVYLEQPTGFEAKYLQMLQAGGTLRHKELLAPFGLDASKPDFWQKGLNVIASYIDELEKAS